MRLRGFLPAATVAAVVAIAGLLGAFASHLAIVDADDTRGLLDISLVQMRGDGPPSWKVRTYGRWRAADIFDVGFGIIHLDTFGSPRFDYYALVTSNGYRMRATLFRDRAEKRDLRVSRLVVWRPGRRSFTVRVPLRLLFIGGRRTAYRWQAETLFTSDRCRAVCFDRAPDIDAVAEPLPLPSPTTTPTPTPSSS